MREQLEKIWKDNECRNPIHRSVWLLVESKKIYHGAEFQIDKNTYAVCARGHQVQLKIKNRKY